ncbi:MAG TPA: glycosyltransferase family 2 protein [Acidimicrobiales bacterium]|jgi:GT2 family glycosyltransferase|nr:glycosyltransferase family 2 protein [Acidimicrobiales bacterium]
MSAAEAASPKVSVCVATYRRPEKLERLLDHLADLQAPAGGFEVVVVDDGSPATDGVTQVLAARTADFPVPLRWVTLPKNSGRAAARNTAWRRATGEWVAFTDDDCRPDPKWLHALVEAAESGGDAPAVVQGRVVPDPERVGLLANPLARSLRVDTLSELFETANILYRTEVLESVGGFDESFPGAGEDTDLGWRVREHGYATTFAPEALVIHDVDVRTFRQDLRDRRRWGDVVRVVKLHPETRRLAWRPHVFRRSHVGPLVVAGGLPLVLMGSKGRLVYSAAVLFGLAKEVKGTGPRTAWPRLQVLAGDFYEVGIVIRSSLRQRTVLL